MTVLAVIVLSGCAGWRPFPTPFVHQPPLPRSDPFPITAEDLVATLEADGLECAFTPDSDIPGGWRCAGGIAEPWGGDVAFAPEDGPLLSLGASLSIYGDGSDPEPEAPDPAEFDAFAAEVFSRLVVAPVLGDATPSIEELTQAVRDNLPYVVDEKWLLHFGRNSRLRTIGIIYQEP